MVGEQQFERGLARRAHLVRIVITTIPSAAGVAQEGQRLGRPSIFTAHRKQEAEGSKPSTWQSVGIERPSLRAALRIVVPGATETGWPSMVRLRCGHCGAKSESRKPKTRKKAETRRPKSEAALRE